MGALVENTAGVHAEIATGIDGHPDSGNHVVFVNGQVLSIETKLDLSEHSLDLVFRHRARGKNDFLCMGRIDLTGAQTPQDCEKRVRHLFSFLLAHFENYAEQKYR